MTGQINGSDGFLPPRLAALRRGLIVLLFFLARHIPVLAELPSPDETPRFTAEQMERLNEGEPVFHADSYRTDDGLLFGEGASYVLVEASPDEVFRCILDFDRYDEVYPFVEEYRLYSREGNDYYVHTLLSALRIINFRYRHHNRYDADRHLLTWSLVEDYDNDFHYFEGYWRTWPREDGSTLLGFVGRVGSVTHVPAFVGTLVSEWILKILTRNVKRRVESGRCRR